MKAKILMILAAAVVLFAACKGRGNAKYEAINNATGDSAQTRADTTQGPKLVKTAGIGFKVKNVQQSSENISTLTAKCGGMVIHHRISSIANSSNDIKVSDDSIMRVSAFYTTGEMVVKVPSEKLEVYLDSVSHLGIYVNTSNMDIEDKSLDYLASKLKLNSRKELISQQKKGKVIIKDPSAVLNLKDDLVDEQIGNRRIDDAVRYSVVSLNFYQSNSIVKEMIANDDPSAYQISFFKRLGLAFENGWRIFNEFILFIADLWVFLLAAGLAWYFIRAYKRKGNLGSHVV